MSSSTKSELSRRRAAQGEHRLPPVVAVLVAIVAYGLLPDTVLFTPRLVIPLIEVVLLAALITTNTRRRTRKTRWSRWISISLAVVVLSTNLASLGLLIDALSAKQVAGGSLLVAAMQFWVTDVIGFALVFWEIDRGGPVARRAVPRDRLPPADWRFSQDENKGAVVEVAKGSSETSGWVPVFVDYLYLSLTNSSAFRPHRHHAPDHTGQDPDGHRGNCRVTHDAARHRPRRQRPRLVINDQRDLCMAARAIA